jgi:hypothetical protein
LARTEWPGYDNSNDVCCVCLDAERDVVFAPCGHLCMCKSCHDKLPVAQTIYFYKKLGCNTLIVSTLFIVLT